MTTPRINKSKTRGQNLWPDEKTIQNKYRNQKNLTSAHQTKKKMKMKLRETTKKKDLKEN